MDTPPYDLLLICGLVCAGSLLLAGLVGLIGWLIFQRLFASRSPGAGPSPAEAAPASAPPSAPHPSEAADGRPLIARLNHERRLMELNIDNSAVNEEVEMFSVEWQGAAVEVLDLNDHDTRVHFLPPDRLAGPGPYAFESAHVRQLRGLGLRLDRATGLTEVILGFTDGDEFSLGLTPRRREAERWAAAANRLLERLQASPPRSG